MAVSKLQIREVGKIVSIKQSIAKITGLDSCMNGQLLDITSHAKAMVLGIVKGETFAFLLGKVDEVSVGQAVYNNMEPFTISVGSGFLGRVVNALAQPIDSKGPPVPFAGNYSLFREAAGVLDRVPLHVAFQSGIQSIDATIPIGKGQRELIVGDRMTGKTTICVDAILNQKKNDVICIYCCIGRSFPSLKRIVETLKAHDAIPYTVIVAATASSSVGEQYLAPYTGCTLGEYFMDNGHDVFVVFDDLTKHAWAYRQLSLLLERPPGRDAYPGDIFYVHSQLMERAGKLNPERGGGSMTFFPIVDTLQGDITGYVPSNLVSMTDGQIYLNTTLFSAGFKPAVDLGLSVSRIGNKVQSPAMKELSSMLRLEYIQYRELLKVTKFKSTLSEEMTRQIEHGEAITQIFIQNKNEPRSLEHQILLLYALKKSVLDLLSWEEREHFKEEIEKFAQRDFSEMLEQLVANPELTPELTKQLDTCLVKFFRKKDLDNIWDKKST